MPIDLEDRGSALENEYFRRQEQELLAKMKAKMETEEAEVTSLKCPKCDGNLVEAVYENITIDACNKCQGVWLDAGELTQIIKKDEGGWFSNLFN
mgnify:CR=1 FL=1